MSPRPHLSFCACKPAWLASELLVSMGLNPYLFFLHAKQRFWSRITSLYMSQTSSVVLCTQNSVISIRITSLYGSQTSSVVFIFKTAHYGQEILVSLGPRPYLSFCACKTTWFAPEWQVYTGSSPHLCFFPCKTATLGPDLQVSIGPRLHLWFWAHITACLAPEKRLYGFQPSPVVLCMQNGDFSIWNTILYWSQPSSVVFVCKTETCGPAYKSLSVPDLTCRFVHTNQRD